MNLLCIEDYEYDVIPMGHKKRKYIEQLVFDKYEKTYDAKISGFAPKFLAISKIGQAISLVGVREPRVSEQFFLENYVSRAIEDILSTNFNLSVKRESIVEVCNFVSFSSGGGVLMIMALSSWINQNGFEWVIFTGTKHLREIFRKLSINCVELINAEKTQLSVEEQIKWGTYYESNPVVIAMDPKEAEITLKTKFKESYMHIEKEISLIL